MVRHRLVENMDSQLPNQSKCVDFLLTQCDSHHYPLLSIPFHSLNFSISYLILFAICTRWSAYNTSCGHPNQHSCDNASSTIMNKKGQSTEVISVQVINVPCVVLSQICTFLLPNRVACIICPVFRQKPLSVKKYHWCHSTTLSSQFG